MGADDEDVDEDDDEDEDEDEEKAEGMGLDECLMSYETRLHATDFEILACIWSILYWSSALANSSSDTRLVDDIY
jgi:hypothetical protein